MGTREGNIDTCMSTLDPSDYWGLSQVVVQRQHGRQMTMPRTVMLQDSVDIRNSQRFALQQIPLGLQDKSGQPMWSSDIEQTDEEESD